MSGRRRDPPAAAGKLGLATKPAKELGDGRILCDLPDAGQARLSLANRIGRRHLWQQFADHVVDGIVDDNAIEHQLQAQLLAG